MVGRRLVPVALLLAVAAVAAPAQAAPPPDAFCVILFEALDGFRVVRVTVDQETNLTERQDLFQALDRNGDGVVALPEADELRRETMDARSGTFANQTHRLAVYWNNGSDGGVAYPLHSAVWRQVGHTFHKQNHTQPWPVTEAVDLETQEVREASFSVPADVTVVSLDGGEEVSLPPGVAIEYVVIRAPPGWSVLGVEGYDYDGWFRIDANATEVDVPAFDTKQPFHIYFGPQASANKTETLTETVTVTASPGPDSRGSPAPTLAVLALAVAAAVTLRRRP